MIQITKFTKLSVGMIVSAIVVENDSWKVQLLAAGEGIPVGRRQTCCRWHVFRNVHRALIVEPGCRCQAGRYSVTFQQAKC